jgi:hypothetical protein
LAKGVERSLSAMVTIASRYPQWLLRDLSPRKVRQCKSNRGSWRKRDTAESETQLQIKLQLHCICLLAQLQRKLWTVTLLKYNSCVFYHQGIFVFLVSL